MLIKKLFSPWRRNVALHATLITRQVTRIDSNSRDLVQMDNSILEGEVKSQLKLRGATEDGIEVYANIELIGRPDLLEQFKFVQGQHVALIIRAID